jgi:hypothetical protein
MMRARLASVAVVLAACGGEPPRLVDTAANKADSLRESAPTARAGDSLPPGVTLDVGSQQFPVSQRLGSLEGGAPAATLTVADTSCIPGKCVCSGRFAIEWGLNSAAIRDTEISACAVADFDGDGDWDASLPGGEGKSVMVFMQGGSPSATWFLDGGAVAEVYPPSGQRGPKGEPVTKNYALLGDEVLYEWRDTMFVRYQFVSRTIAPSTGEYSINAGGVGHVRLNFTLDEVRRALPSATFKRTSDGDGLALIEVTLGRDTAVVIYAGEDDAGAPIDWPKRVERIEVFSPAFHTGEGVRPGAWLADVEKIYGKVTEISVSEIESREYVEFEKQPPSLTFRLNYTGIFAQLHGHLRSRQSANDAVRAEREDPVYRCRAPVISTSAFAR